MDQSLKSVLWNQCGAAIDTLENAILECPEQLWGDRSQQPEYWYIAYHTLFWLDFYFSDSHEGFAPPAPFTLCEMDPAGLLPERVYSKAELLDYLQHGRRKARAAIENLTDEKSLKHFKFGSADLSYLELIPYNMRHVQHHAAQLNLILRQKTNSAPRWVFRAKNHNQ